jgi:hypothetical protein
MTPSANNRAPAGPARSQTPSVARVAALQAAATFAAGKALNQDVSSADVLRVAEAFECWVS